MNVYYIFIELLLVKFGRIIILYLSFIFRSFCTEYLYSHTTLIFCAFIPHSLVWPIFGTYSYYKGQEITDLQDISKVSWHSSLLAWLTRPSTMFDTQKFTNAWHIRLWNGAWLTGLENSRHTGLWNGSSWTRLD